MGTHRLKCTIERRNIHVKIYVVFLTKFVLLFCLVPDLDLFMGLTFQCTVYIKVEL